MDMTDTIEQNEEGRRNSNLITGHVSGDTVEINTDDMDVYTLREMDDGIDVILDEKPMTRNQSCDL